MGGQYHNHQEQIIIITIIYIIKNSIYKMRRDDDHEVKLGLIGLNGTNTDKQHSIQESNHPRRVHNTMG